MKKEQSTSAARIPIRDSKLVLNASLALAASMLIVVAGMLIASRSLEWKQAEQLSSNVKHAVIEDVRTQIGLYGRILDIAAGFLSGPKFEGMPADLTKELLARMVHDFDSAGVIIILDKDGFSVADSADRSKRTDNFADRKYFAVQRYGMDPGLYISAPYKSRLRQGDPSIALSRRITDPSGNFAGVVVASIRLDHFQKLFSAIDLGPKGTISLVSSNGIVLMRQPSSDGAGDVGRDVSQSANFRALKFRDEGAIVGTTSIDGVERLISFGKVAGYPLLVNVSLATSEILAKWWHEAIGFGGVSLLVCIAIAVLAFNLQHKIDEIEKAREALSGIAATDGLTGLSNRREFDAVISKEWQRAFRERTPLSVLIIDADHFKQVNDRFGHAEGDTVLKQLALQIRANLMRVTDTAARYGGEEFAVILPNTDGAGAMVVAETIRLAVERTAKQAQQYGKAAVSISIGAASIIPGPTTSPERLLAWADGALYRAKASGRNRSELAEPTVSSAVEMPPASTIAAVA